MRSAAAAAVVLAVIVLIAACDSAKTIAARAGIGGFEARCETSLPPTRIEVVTVPVVYGTDKTRSWRELTAKSGDATPTLRALGLTTAEVGHQATIETSGVEDPRSGRVCVRPAIRVELSATPMTVYIGREIAGDPCKEAVALEHELKHVAVYKDELANIAKDVRASLDAAYGNRVLYYGSRAEAKRETQAALAAQLSPLLAGDARRIKERQRTVDSPEEYARVSAACGGMMRN
ncbi:MAG: hypothetical protein ABI569_10195 [Casimicrobiaceae bacterium]